MFYLGMIQCVKLLLLTFEFSGIGGLQDFQQLNIPAVFEHYCPEQME